jgi:hypothetical protein
VMSLVPGTSRSTVSVDLINPIHGVITHLSGNWVSELFIGALVLLLLMAQPRPNKILSARERT